MTSGSIVAGLLTPPDGEKNATPLSYEVTTNVNRHVVQSAAAHIVLMLVCPQMVGNPVEEGVRIAALACSQNASSCVVVCEATWTLLADAAEQSDCGVSLHHTKLVRPTSRSLDSGESREMAGSYGDGMVRSNDPRAPLDTSMRPVSDRPTFREIAEEKVELDGLRTSTFVLSGYDPTSQLRVVRPQILFKEHTKPW